MKAIDALGTLNEPVRRRLYEFVAAQQQPVSRNEAAEGCGIQRTLAAFHLDRLVEAGLLDVSYRRLTGRSGPGAGRPAKLYRRADTEYVVSVPPRSYGLAARVFADALEQLSADAEVGASARKAGRQMGTASVGADLDEVLRAQGYEPYEDDGEIRLRNCPFHRLAERDPVLVCGMNVALCEGILEGLGMPDRVVRIDPRSGDCCAVVSKTKEA